MNTRLVPHFPQVPLERVPLATKKDRRPRVLSVSLDRALASTRSMVLERAGFRVETVGSADEAKSRLLDSSYDAVVVGHSLSKEERAGVLKAARAAKSAPWIVGLYKLSPSEAAGAHMAIDTQDCPEALVYTLRRIAQGGAQAPKLKRG